MYERHEGACDLSGGKNKFNRASTLYNLLTQCHVLVLRKMFSIIKILSIKNNVNKLLKMRVAHVATDTREATPGVMSMTTIKFRERSSSWQKF